MKRNTDSWLDVRVFACNLTFFHCSYYREEIMSMPSTDIVTHTPTPLFTFLSILEGCWSKKELDDFYFRAVGRHAVCVYSETRQSKSQVERAWVAKVKGWASLINCWKVAANHELDYTSTEPTKAARPLSFLIIQF